MKKWMRRLFSRSTWGMLTLFFVILFAITLIAEPILIANEGWINGYLDITTYIKVDDNANETPDVMYFKPDYMQYRWVINEETGKYEFETRWDKAALYNHLREVTNEVNVEGSVLLKNDNDALPLKNGTSVSLFGVSQMRDNYITTGEGSGFHASNTTDTLKRCLAANGVGVNEKLYSQYERSAQTHRRLMKNTFPDGDLNYVEFEVNEAPFSELKSAADSTIGAGKAGDTAVFILSRLGAENGDTDFSAKDHVGNNYMDLTQEEKSVLDALVQYKKDKALKHIVLVLNTCNAMQFKTIATYDIDAVIWVGTGGTSSFTALADVLSGKGNPSGKLADGSLLGFISDTDLYSLFGNIIDNAMEAVTKIEDDDKRNINIIVKNVNSFVSISVDNYFMGELVFSSDGLLKSDKGDNGYHGYGLKSVQMISEKYGGDLKISAKD